MEIIIHNPNALPTADYRSLIPIQGNLKDLKEKNYKKLKKSFERYGFKIPFFVWIPTVSESVLVDGEDFEIEAGKMYLLDGHQRHRLLTTEGCTPFELPYVLIEAENFLKAKEMILVISSQYGTMTREGLDSFGIEQEFFEEFVNFDAIVDFGIGEEEESDEVLNDDYEAKAPLETDIVEGDYFEIGKHRLVCGDSEKHETFEKLMQGEEGDLLFCDPPYGYEYESNHQDTHEMLKNDDKILKFLPVVKDYLKEDCGVFLYCSWQTIREWIDEVENAGLNLKNMIIWKKNNWSMGDLKGSFAGQHEIILFAHKGRIEIVGSRDSDIWEFDRVKPTFHPTPKNPELAGYAFSKTIGKGAIVIDCFAGEGSTLVACEQTSRKAYLVELEPKYCHVIIDRAMKLNPNFVVKRNGLVETEKWI
jgi:site-specific DNA-methyltransferase (adenine-specific)